MNYSKTCCECGLCLYEHEWELLDGMCPKCYDNLKKDNYYNSSDHILRDYYRNEFDKEINK